MRKPNFENLLKVLNREQPDRTTLFELFLNPILNEKLTGTTQIEGMKGRQNHIDAFAAAGYDYATMSVPDFFFVRSVRARETSVSLNDGAMITNEDEFNAYNLWPNPKKSDFDKLKEFSLPAGMKLVVFTPDGLLENTIGLMGYDNLCLNLYDNRELVRAVIDKVGAALLNYYEEVCKYDCVGAVIANDDWGFNSMPMIDPASMREFIVPWNTKFVEAAHAANRPVIQHSCGNIYDCNLIEDVIDTCKFDAHHSFEDKILPVEKAYLQYHDRIALLGGIDLDFLCRRTPEEIRKRCNELLELTNQCTGYALGSGNSIPDYVPCENYFAMIETVTKG